MTSMESHRSTKRRKLDPTEHESHKSSPVPQRTSKPFTYSKKSISAARDALKPAQPLTNRTNASAAHDAWLEAKATSQARRGKQTEIAAIKCGQLDVYDDIEGAHAHEAPLMRTLPKAAPAKKSQDPLRNQKAAAATSSPSQAGASLGFFKQFHQPKSASDITPSKKPPSGERPTNGTRQHEDQAGAGAALDNSSSQDGESEVENDGPVWRSGKASWKGWTYDVPKKTFEDEIKELENVARREADDEEEPDATVGASQNRRNRTSTPKQIENDKARGKVTVIKTTPQKRLLGSGGRKGSRAEQPKVVSVQSGEDKARLEVADSDEKNLLLNRDPQARSLVIPTKAKLEHPLKLSVVKDASFSTEHLRIIRKITLEKLTGKRSFHLANLDDEYAKVSHLVAQTIAAGESNSMLVIGARGSGKTALVNLILREALVEHPDDFHVVRLNGFIHTDDRIALREIWRQLGREMELDDEESMSKNYADTMTRLLALLSHPAEQGREQADQVTKSVIFILDEFELFASHPRQTLLYNLFDIAQSRKAPIAVLGLTTRIDVAESLEKRVKSRFSHRYVHLSSAKSLAAFQEGCKAALAIRENDLTTDERERLGIATELISKLEASSKIGQRGSISDWNAFVETLLSQEVLANHLKLLYYTTKSVPEFHESVLMAICTLSVEHAATTNELVEHFTNNISGWSLRPPDSKLDLLSSLSTLQLALLICAARLTNIHNSDTVPFAQTYEEYKVLASKAKLQATASGALAQGAGSRIFSKDVAKGAWEELVEVGLVMQEGSRGGRVDVGLEEIGMSGVELGSWARWCREI